MKNTDMENADMGNADIVSCLLDEHWQYLRYVFGNIAIL